jgi:hypothetical protein
MKPSEEALESLFVALVDDLKGRLENGETVYINGEEVKCEAKPATLAVIRQLLKDNDIRPMPGTSPELEALASALPSDFGDYDKDA